MRRVLGQLVLTGLLVTLGRPVHAMTELVVSSPGLQQNGFTTPPRTARLTPPDYSFTTYDVAFSVPGSGVVSNGLYLSLGSYSLSFAPPTAHYAVGSYTGVYRYGLQAGMTVSGWETNCEPTAAEYDVLDVAYGPNDHVTRFSVDFVVHCTGVDRMVTGSLRLAAGDATCSGAADGTLCDDLDACSATSSCDAGVCVGGGAVQCPGPVDSCHDASICAPATGQCLVGTPSYQNSTCDDGDPCTEFDRCQDGVCQATSFLGCYDTDPCTLDRCQTGVGCTFPPSPGECGNPGTPSTFLFVESPPGERIGLGRDWVVANGENDAAIYPAREGGTIVFVDPQGDYGKQWSVTLLAPNGKALAPGVYENTRPQVGYDTDRPYLSLYRWGSSVICDQPSGRFEIEALEMSSASGVFFRIDTLRATAEFRCEPTDPPLTAVIRFRAGDPTCVGQPDGTPCDDANACTSGDTCRSGVCAGGTPVACGDASPCHGAPICDPRTGACRPASVGDDNVACSDPDGCVPTGTCQNGTCTAEHPPCDDLDVCTTDVCDGAGSCVHGPIDGTCWALRGTTTFVARALGHACSCTTRTKVQPLALYANGTFAYPGGPTDCGGSTVIVPNEIGQWSQTGRRYVLTTTNLAEIVDAGGQCAGIATEITRYRTTVRIVADGRRLTGVHTERGHSTEGVRVFASATTQLRGKPTDHGIAKAGHAAVVKCARRLAACLTDAIRN